MKVKLGNICNIQSGGTPSRQKKEYWENGNIPWIKISDFSGKYLKSSEENITEKGLENSSAKMFHKGTILYSIYATLGEVTILDIDASTNQAIVGLTIIDDNISKDYLYYSLMSLKGYVNFIGRGATQNNINMNILRNIEIPIVSLAQQHHIVAILDQVNDLISLRYQQLEQLDLLVKSRFVEMFGDPVLNEKGWEITNLINVAEIKIGPFGSLLHKEDYVYEKHALVNPSHIIDSKIVIDKNLTVKDEKYNELIPYHLKIGDVVLGRRGEMGRCAVVEENGLLCGTGSIIIRPNNKIKSYFLQKTLSNPVYKKILEQKAVGTTMPNLNVPIVSNLRIPLYPLALQNQFAAFVEEVEKEKATVKQSLEWLNTLKAKLMQDYFG